MLRMGMVVAVVLGATGTEVPPSRPDAGPSTLDPRRAFASEPPGRAALAIRKAPPGEQFGAAFAYGEGIGLTADLPELVGRAQTLPVGLQQAFIDGAAHTWAPPPAVPPEAVGARIQADVPQPWRPAFHNGVLLSWSIAHRADPAAVVPRAEAYRAATGARIEDGVRVGLQRALGDDLPAALAVAATYPDAWQPALFEELGWRAGDEGASVCALAAVVPAERRCAFVHGAARGRTLQTDWSADDAAPTLARGVAADACGCDAAAWRGVAWGLALLWGHRPNRARTFARHVDTSQTGAGVGQGLSPLLGGVRGAPWDDIPE